MVIITQAIKNQPKLKILVWNFAKNTAGRNTPSDFNRGVGVGKSHLAIGCLNEILVKSNYSKKVLFVSYRELLEQLKFAMNDEEARKAITGVAMSEIKAADVVVLDDIGAELGDFNKRDEKAI